MLLVRVIGSSLGWGTKAAFQTHAGDPIAAVWERLAIGRVGCPRPTSPSHPQVSRYLDVVDHAPFTIDQPEKSCGGSAQGFGIGYVEMVAGAGLEPATYGL